MLLYLLSFYRVLAPIVVEQVLKSIQQINGNVTTVLLAEHNATKPLQTPFRGYILQRWEIIVEGGAADLIESEIIKKAYLSI